MSKLTCADVTCEYRNENGICTCEEVDFSSGQVYSVNREKIKVWYCRNYKISSEYIKIKEMIEDVIELAEGRHR